ncbi:NADPH-dependent FMN reductase [Ruminiclostridium papyrosolvens DSM 2782]|uniref:NADPH-dependent FMN reductase n=1 Tax=Ruminiclostridium papyrosolvens DSM 2782 TaxID=588581 RepID=F1TDR5_9FIRM|nr:flavodoxin family protein [Ruminiclostridium papyrosolvens]EGD47361.1 NADPH-dependent FMN reductase [Ruminiclostridium papyrosolvens DSM 2782]WES34707.1 flavodoxin family protein [Ruminiclostridium papyrosolvens DSM 2782]
MIATLVYDGDIKTQNSEIIHNLLLDLFLQKNIEVKLFEVNRNNIRNCMGCNGCWIVTPGECVIEDSLNNINKSYVKSDLVVYLTPVVFGQYSSAIKNVMDRFIPNVLPFFEEKNGATVHPSRYEKYPRQILIGYGDDITEEERDTFFTLTSGKYNKNFDKVLLTALEKDNQEIISHIL